MYCHVMAKSMQVLTFRWDAEFVESLRLVAGPRGMSRFVREALERELAGPDWSGAFSAQVIAEPKTKAGSVRDLVASGQVTTAASLVTKPSTKDHPFKEGKSAFKCEICGVNRGSH